MDDDTVESLQAVTDTYNKIVEPGTFYSCLCLNSSPFKINNNSIKLFIRCKPQTEITFFSSIKLYELMLARISTKKYSHTAAPPCVLIHWWRIFQSAHMALKNVCSDLTSAGPSLSITDLWLIWRWAPWTPLKSFYVTEMQMMWWRGVFMNDNV